MIEHRLYSSIRDSFYNFRLFFLSTGSQPDRGVWELQTLLLGQAGGACRPVNDKSFDFYSEDLQTGWKIIKLKVLFE